MRRYGLILTAAAMLLAGSAGSAAADGGRSGDAGGGHSAAAVSGASKSVAAKKKKARKKAMRKCRKIQKRAKRKACVKRVRKKFAAHQDTSGGPPAAVIDVRDKYFSPDLVEISAGESILWVWNSVNTDPHNVNLAAGPPGVKRIDFETPSSPAVGFQFKRTFTVPGTYDFVCSIHYNMKMQVEVSK